MQNMRKSRVAIVCLVAALVNLAIWGALNRPQSAKPYTGKILGVSYSPFQKNQSPLERKYPTPAEIDSDLRLLSGKVSQVRTYASTEGQEVIPALAQKHQLRVTAGAWLDKDREKNERELANLIANARNYDNIDRVMVGNESILRADLNVPQLRAYAERVRAATGKPVGTAEPWHVWLEHPELADSLDFIAVHLLPYWEGVPSKRALGWALESLRRVEKAHPGKPIIIGEIGWPSGGQRWKEAKPSLVSQAQFVREFLNVAEARKFDYFIIEAFDQPWKRDLEGSAGAHWGVFDQDREPKYPMTGELREVANWPLMYGFASLLAMLPILLFLRHWTNLRRGGQIFFACLTQIASSILTWTLFVPFTQDISTAGLIVWALLLPAQAGLLLVVLTNGVEMAEMLWIRKWRRKQLPLDPKPDQHLPKVSIHLAIYNEPPDLVKKTLDGLAALDYPDYEVLIIDNNTKNEEVWRPVQEYCELLGSKFRFYHLPKWPGFKAGALNFALKETDPAAEVVGVIDSDYIVKSDWLRSLVPYFEREEVGFVQAPQDNREWQGDLFKTMINWEYNGFFNIGMVHRNERNAIIQHGTMTLVRRSAFEKVGHWSEWCICEDAELGLRLFHAGYESVYVNHNFGEGVTPDTFAGFKTQRFRWTYGAVQILRHHWRKLVPWKQTGLTLGQKFHFVTGWLPWFTDALHLLFTFAGIFWTMGMLLFPRQFEIPLAIFLYPTLGLFVFKVCHSMLLYRAKVQCSFWQRIGAAIAGMGLTHVIARAIFLGVFTKSQPFLRTPKGENKPALFRGVLMAWEETQIFLLLWLTVLANFIFFGFNHPEGFLWGFLLGIQSIPYGAALATSVASSMPTIQIRLPWRSRRYLLRWRLAQRRRSLGSAGNRVSS
jgi:exo-beta-1,3-glucanase (GH17 family)/cellulose synthase/poly-beta-1,6-N-acetylglucosamine synthase-like glycosyltransferase